MQAYTHTLYTSICFQWVHTHKPVPNTNTCRHIHSQAVTQNRFFFSLPFSLSKIHAILFSLHTFFPHIPLLILLPSFSLYFPCKSFCAPFLYMFSHLFFCFLTAFPPSALAALPQVSHLLPDSLLPLCFTPRLPIFLSLSVTVSRSLALSLSLSLSLISTHSLFDSVQSSCFLSSLKTLKINMGCGGKEVEEMSVRGRARQTPVTQQFSSQFPVFFCVWVSMCVCVCSKVGVCRDAHAYFHAHTLSVILPLQFPWADTEPVMQVCVFSLW